MNLIIAIIAADRGRQKLQSIVPSEIHVNWTKNYTINIYKLTIFNIIISYIFEKYCPMAWRRFGLEIINESGIVMHDRHVSSNCETIKVHSHMIKVISTFNALSTVSFWTRFTLLLYISTLLKYKYTNTDEMIVNV